MNAKRIFSTLKKIAFTRPAGTDEERAAADIIMEEIRSLGLEPHKEEFEIDDADVKAELKALSPYEKTYHVVGTKHSKSTGEDGITTEFIYADDAVESNYAKLNGKLCLFGKLSCNNSKLADVGIAGILNADGKATDKTNSADLYQAAYPEKEHNMLTSMTISGSDAFEMVKNGVRKVWFRLENHSYKAKSQNIAVTVPGTELPDEIIAIGAHYDSVPVGCGACDNGAGSAIIMELLRAFVQSPPRRTLKFIWFGSEEIGLFGSEAYLEAHKEELDSYRLMVNVDVGGSVMGNNFVRATCDESVAHYIEFLAKEAGYIADIAQGLMGSDSTPFAGKSIPAVGFGRGAADSVEFCHTRNDLMAYISPKALNDTAEFVLMFVKKMCDAKIFPVPRMIPENIKKRVNDRLGGN